MVEKERYYKHLLMYLLKPYGRKGTLLYDSRNGEESRIMVNNREYLESPAWFVLVTTAKYILFSGHWNIDLFTGRKLTDIYGTFDLQDYGERVQCCFFHSKCQCQKSRLLAQSTRTL